MNCLNRLYRYYNSIKYMKPEQIKAQIEHRMAKRFVRENCWKEFEKHRVIQKIQISIPDLDQNSEYLSRFNPDEILAGKITLLYETRKFDGTKWKYEDCTPLWNYNLHYFEYGISLAEKYRETRNNQYVACFCLLYTRRIKSNSRLAWEPYTISLRVRNLLIAVEIFGESLNSEFLQLLYNSIYQQYTYLQSHTEKHLMANHYFENICTILIGSVLFKETDVYKKWWKILEKEIQEEILPDGVHFERSLMYHKIIMEDLMRVAVVIATVHVEDTNRLLPVLQKMLNAGYSLELGCNRTPLFNDSGDNVAKPINAIVKAMQRQFHIVPSYRFCFENAGYYKLLHQEITVIVDAGSIGPDYIPGHVQCDALSFELFYQGNPVLVNSGTGLYQGKERAFFRSTKAHNTAVINGHEQSECWAEHRVARRMQYGSTIYEKNELRGNYKNYFGEQHRRVIHMENSELSIEDQVTAKKVNKVESYLHISPEFHIREEGDRISIEKAGISVCKITSINCKRSIETSIYAPEFGKIISNQTIVFTWNDNQKHGYRIQFTY